MRAAGQYGSLYLFVDEDNAAVLDTTTNTVVRTGTAHTLRASAAWATPHTAPSRALTDLAAGALTDLDVRILASGDRMYTVPKAAQAEAKRGLEWRAEHNRGGTPVGVNSARTLARGGQIGIRKVRHIAKYFPRHEIDKKGKGWKTGEDGWPSRGRIAWALWGGDPAWRWARAIVERENKKKKAVRADAYSGMVEAEYDLFGDNTQDLREFWNAELVDVDIAVEFVARVNLEEGGIDRLYKVQPEGVVLVWDGIGWEDLGHISHDFETYDKSLDDPSDKAPRIHVPIDAMSAMKVSAFLQQNPYSSIGPSMLEPEESILMADAANEIDWELIDRTTIAETDDAEFAKKKTPCWSGYKQVGMKKGKNGDMVPNCVPIDAVVAAGEEGLSKDSTPGVYTPEERSENASGQVRDAAGKFAAAGTKVFIGGDRSATGIVKSVDSKTGQVSIALDNGKLATIGAQYTQGVDDNTPALGPSERFDAGRLDTTNILAKPRVPQNSTSTTLPGLLPALTQNDVGLMLRDWSAWATAQRVAPSSNIVANPSTTEPGSPTATPAAPATPATPAAAATPVKYGNVFSAPNAYNDPMLRSWLDQKYKGQDGTDRYINRGWYNPIVMPGLEGRIQKTEEDGSKVSAQRDRAGEQKAAVGRGPNVYYKPNEVPTFMPSVQPKAKK